MLYVSLLGQQKGLAPVHLSVCIASSANKVSKYLGLRSLIALDGSKLILGECLTYTIAMHA